MPASGYKLPYISSQHAWYTEEWQQLRKTAKAIKRQHRKLPTDKRPTRPYKTQTHVHKYAITHYAAAYLYTHNVNIPRRTQTAGLIPPAPHFSDCSAKTPTFSTLNNTLRRCCRLHHTERSFPSCHKVFFIHRKRACRQAISIAPEGLNTQNTYEKILFHTSLKRQKAFRHHTWQAQSTCPYISESRSTTCCLSVLHFPYVRLFTASNVLYKFSDG